MTRNQQRRLKEARKETDRHRRRARTASWLVLGGGASTWTGHLLLSGPSPVPFPLATAWIAAATALAVLHSSVGRRHLSLAAAFGKALRRETLSVRQLLAKLRELRGSLRLQETVDRARGLPRARSPANRLPGRGRGSTPRPAR